MRTGRPLNLFCKQGHLMSENCRILKRGTRVCIPCNKESGKKWRTNHPEQVRNKLRISGYKKLGITLSQWNDLFNKQQGKCAICGTHQTNLSKSLNIDHDHLTGKIRGLLCMQCNVVLGHIHDDVSILQRMISYLQKETGIDR